MSLYTAWRGWMAEVDWLPHCLAGSSRPSRAQFRFVVSAICNEFAGQLLAAAWTARAGRLPVRMSRRAAGFRDRRTR
jgi:hypothetical protein